MDTNKILNQYREIVGVDSLKARNLIKKLEYKEDEYLLQCIAQTYIDESLLEDDGRMRTYLDKKKWRMAERYIIKAFTINQNNSDVLWVMGKVRKAYGQVDIAVFCYKKIIELGSKGGINRIYGLGINHAKELVNDSKFELYRIYHDIDKILSKKYLSQYKNGLTKGISSIYEPHEMYLLDE